MTVQKQSIRWRERSRLKQALQLYLVMDLQGTETLNAIQIAEAAIRGGVTTLQIRDKKADDHLWMTVGYSIRELCAQAGIMFIVNDRVDLAKQLRADGVHLGQDDLSVEQAREIVGQEVVIGLSVGNELEYAIAEQTSADYYGVGAVYATSSKADAGEPIGLDLIQSISQNEKIPVVGIGGIHVGNAAAVIQAGACGVAVLSAIGKSTDPFAATREIWKVTHGSPTF